jgi:adenine-specific DNA methylase
MTTPTPVYRWIQMARCDECGAAAGERCMTLDDEKAEHPCDGRAMHAAVNEERQRILQTLQSTGGDVSKAARLLGISRQATLRRMARLKIEVVRRVAGPSSTRENGMCRRGHVVAGDNVIKRGKYEECRACRDLRRNTAERVTP